ncbi:immunity protein Imm33 domain-containing protein [Sporocytophaga myxococcoides]|nr:DUF2185 domain-containing protein [Sporocytophaga myxococcoides]
MELNIGGIIISNKIFHERESPTWMYREIPLEDGDSGWRIFSGNESDESLKDSSNFVIVSSDYIISIDDDIKVNLLAPVGSSFERNLSNMKWSPVKIAGEDYEP